MPVAEPEVEPLAEGCDELGWAEPDEDELGCDEPVELLGALPELAWPDEPDALVCPEAVAEPLGVSVEALPEAEALGVSVEALPDAEALGVEPPDVEPPVAALPDAPPDAEAFGGSSDEEACAHVVAAPPTTKASAVKMLNTLIDQTPEMNTAMCSARTEGCAESKAGA